MTQPNVHKLLAWRCEELLAQMAAAHPRIYHRWL
jgi:hypothetical protein